MWWGLDLVSCKLVVGSVVGRCPCIFGCLLGHFVFVSFIFMCFLFWNGSCVYIMIMAFVCPLAQCRYSFSRAVIYMCEILGVCVTEYDSVM